MKRVVLAALAVALALASALVLADPATPDADAGKRAWADVYRVLESPRCRNCHPAGDAPLQTDTGHAHAMHISRATVAAGVPCTTCHQERNSEALGVDGGPPGAPGWSLPPAATPMVFEGRSAHDLCVQMQDPAQNGHRTLAMLLDHVTTGELVMWAWDPGGHRTIPPLSHDAFVTAFSTWAASGGACP